MNNYKGYSLRNKILTNFIFLCVLCILGCSAVSYYFFSKNAREQSMKDMQRKTVAIKTSLDYAISHKNTETKDLKPALQNKIHEIADIQLTDIIIYDLDGHFILSNKDNEPQQNIPANILNQLKYKNEVHLHTYDEKHQNSIISSYMILKNNMIEPIGIILVPYYHNDSSYLETFNNYFYLLIFFNLIVIILAILISLKLSTNTTKAFNKFSEKISNINLLDKNIAPIKYYKNDEMSPLVKAYNRMITHIQNQKEKLTHNEKEKAWREMAKQVAHEVKNPLTPMKLMVQNFQRKFNPEDPEINEKVNKMSHSLVTQIDLMASVATAFSEFTQLPEKQDEVFDLKKEIINIANIFNDDNIFVHSYPSKIEIKMDKIYLNRIITNLITNAKEAESIDRKLIINIDIEQKHKRISITISDNGEGIEQEMQSKIFQPNFTSKNSGMGLGLSMIRKMVEEYSGEIVLKHSELNKGTTFKITLPSNL